MRKSVIMAMTLSLGLVVSAAVPEDWINKYYPGTLDYEAAAKRLAANGLNTVEEAYVAGINPTNPASVFMASVALSNGMVHVSWTPNLNTGDLARIYKRVGRVKLDEGDWAPVQPWHRFFMVTVAMPTGATGETSDVSGEGFVPEELGGVQLWENGPYWAECNVGATKPEEYGYYFWWGDTVGYTREGGVWTSGNYYSGVTWVSSTGTRMDSSPFNTWVCPTYNKNNAQLFEAGYIDDSTAHLVAAHDAATAHLGAPWRMPTEEEMQALINNCDTTWTTQGGVYGRLVTGRGAYASKSIFLPAAGYGGDTELYYPGSYGYDWSSAPGWDYSDCASGLCFSSSDFSLGGDDRSNSFRHLGRSVRPVRGFAK